MSLIGRVLACGNVQCSIRMSYKRGSSRDFLVGGDRQRLNRGTP
jgi:hypothetical protein